MKKVILLGVISGLVVYVSAVFITQLLLESSIAKVKIFPKLFSNDPALIATIDHSIAPSTFEIKNIKYKEEFNVITWRILQNLEVLAVEDRPDQMSTFINSSLGEVIETNNLRDLQDMTGLELVYEILSRSSKEPNSDIPKERTIKFMKQCMAGTPMAFKQYTYKVKSGDDLNVGIQRFLAFLIPPEFSSGYWDHGSINDLMGLSYKHIGIAKEFSEIEGMDGKLELITSYNQYNDLILKILLLIHNDEDVSAARDRLMVFKGVVQCLIFMTFFVSLYLILFTDFTVESNDRLLELLKTMLPTLGFIGTILGLMRSLGDAYKIPIASGNANTSLAISEITTSLSIAFTTTLLAFILLIIVDIIRVYKLKGMTKDGQ